MLLEILITKHERSYHVTFPYKHQIGWRRFKAIGMVFKEPDNVGGVVGKVYWTIPLNKLDVAVDSIHYWYTEHPQIGEPPYGVHMKHSEIAETETPLAGFATQYQETLDVRQMLTASQLGRAVLRLVGERQAEEDEAA